MRRVGTEIKMGRIPYNKRSMAALCGSGILMHHESLEKFDAINKYDSLAGA